jgi:hypothetical protein
MTWFDKMMRKLREMRKKKKRENRLPRTREFFPLCDGIKLNSLSLNFLFRAV